jgi:hypothetical protein
MIPRGGRYAVGCGTHRVYKPHQLLSFRTSLFAGTRYDRVESGRNGTTIRIPFVL